MSFFKKSKKSSKKASKKSSKKSSTPLFYEPIQVDSSSSSASSGHDDEIHLPIPAREEREINLKPLGSPVEDSWEFRFGFTKFQTPKFSNPFAFGGVAYEPQIFPTNTPEQNAILDSLFNGPDPSDNSDLLNPPESSVELVQLKNSKQLRKIEDNVNEQPVFVKKGFWFVTFYAFLYAFIILILESVDFLYDSFFTIIFLSWGPILILKNIGSHSSIAISNGVSSGFALAQSRLFIKSVHGFYNLFHHYNNSGLLLPSGYALIKESRLYSSGNRFRIFYSFVIIVSLKVILLSIFIPMLYPDFFQN